MTKKQRQDKIKKLRRIRRELKGMLIYAEFWDDIDKLIDAIESQVNVEFTLGKQSPKHD